MWIVETQPRKLIFIYVWMKKRVLLITFILVLLLHNFLTVKKELINFKL